jgi:CheY-like chemotaxis protein
MSATQPHVLALDGSETFLAVLQEVLEEAGYRVTAAREVPTDAGDVRRLDPDVVVLDLLIGGQDAGWRLLRRLRRDPATADMPIVVCTGATALVREVGPELRSLADAVVIKPFDIGELTTAVDRGMQAHA